MLLDTRRKGRRVRQADIPGFVPRSLSTGMLPVARGKNALEVAYDAAARALDTERVCLIYSVTKPKETYGQVESYVHYLAAAAADFSSQLDSGTSLEAALPGTPHHQGEGIYMAPVPEENLVAVVITREHSIKCFVGDREHADRFPDAEHAGHLQTFHVAGGISMHWRGFNEQSKADVRHTLKGMFMTGAVVAVLMGLIWTGASIYASKKQSEVADLAVQAKRAIASATNRLSTATSESRHSAWTELERVTEFVLKHEGRLLSFKLAKGIVAWEMELPANVTGDEIARLGSGIETRPMLANNVVLVNKNAEKK